MRKLFKNSIDEQNENNLTKNITEQAVASTSVAMPLFQQMQEKTYELLKDKEESKNIEFANIFKKELKMFEATKIRTETLDNLGFGINATNFH